MSEFLQLLLDEDAGFFRTAFFGGLLASIAFAVTGTYVVVRRSASIAGAIAHSVLGGIGAALYARDVLGWSWCSPLLGAFAAAILSAVVIGLVTIYSYEREDTIIAALWATGMAVGLLFLRKVPGNVDAMSFIMGDILMVSRLDIWFMAALDVVVIAVTAVFYPQLMAVCFDEEFARLRGTRANLYYLMLLCLTGLSVVLLSRLVGIIMVIALLVIPAAIASQFSRHLWQMMVLSSVCCMAFITAGMAISVEKNLQSGPAIIITAALAYFLLLGGKALWRRFAAR